MFLGVYIALWTGYGVGDSATEAGRRGMGPGGFGDDGRDDGQGSGHPGAALGSDGTDYTQSMKRAFYVFATGEALLLTGQFLVLEGGLGLFGGGGGHGGNTGLPAGLPKSAPEQSVRTAEDTSGLQKAS